MKKRMISLLLAIVMVLGMLPATTLTASAESNYSVWVGGVGMCDGDYLAVGATKTNTTKPSGGYAYYEDGTLTLNNYSYEGKGYLNSSGYYAVIYSKNDLTLELIGNNTLTQTYLDSDMIYVDGANLTVGGDGKLTGTSGGYALYADKDITINGGTIELSTYYSCILSYGGEVIINDGDITAESEGSYAIYSYYDVTVNGGNVTAIGGSKAIDCEASDSFSVAEGMKIQASTTVDGELGEYVAANHDSYKKIVVRSAPDVYVGGVGMNDGDYLAVGATKTNTTKPSGGYAYYKDGTLTLNNYSYEGKGYRYDSEDDYYAVIYAEPDLSINLIGNNTLTQTYFDSDMIYVDGANLTVGGDGKLTGTSRGYALYADKDITINGGTVEVSTYYACIVSHGDVIINDGDITAESEDRAAIYSYYDVTVNGGNVTAIGCLKAIDCEASDSFSVAEGMKIQASTTVDGELGEYVAANHDSYKKIVVRSAPDVYVGGVGMNDGDYLAVGANATTRTMPNGGYAYYKDGVLTLNYFYTTKLVRYYDRYLEVNLIGDNEVGSIADYYYWADSSDDHYTGLEFTGSGDLEIRSWCQPGCEISVNGDVFFNGSGFIFIDADIYCFQYTDNVVINDGYVYCYSAQSGVFGDATNIEVNGGKLEMVDGGGWWQFICDGTVVTAGDVYVSNSARRVQPEECDPWDGKTPLKGYDTVWVVPEGSIDSNKNPFTDVPEGSFYYDPVMWAVENGVTTGATDTTFNPGGKCLRAHVVTFLWRAAGKPEPTATAHPFKDVNEKAYYYKAMLWAVENGITSGMTADTFAPDSFCTRGQVVTFLWRAAGKPEPTSTSHPFQDVSADAYYYKAMLWAVENGITTGVDATHFGPSNPCSRAQVVTFLYRAYN